MKIVHVISNCSAGGAEVLVKNIVKELTEKNNDVQLWVMTRVKDDVFPQNESRNIFETEYINELVRHGIVVKFINKRANKDILKSWICIRKLYSEFEPDVINTHLEKVTFHTIMGLLGTKAKIVQTIHNTVIVHPFLQRALMNLMLKSYVAISVETRKEIEKIGISKNKIFDIQNGVNLSVYLNRDKVFNKNIIEIIAVGRFVEQKNYPLLIEVFSRLKDVILSEYNIEPRLNIVGDGESKQEIYELIINKGLGRYINLLGIRNDVPELLNSADIYLMTSKWEGLSISLIEAAASGLPIVASNVGSNSKIVKNNQNGFIIDSFEVDEYVTKILELIISQEKLYSFSKESRRIAKQYSIENTSIKYLEMYNKIVYKK